MTEDDLDTVDGQLGVRLPEEYRAILLAPPVGLRRLIERREVYDDVWQIVNVTLDCRLNGVGDAAFPPDLVAIGDTGTGDVFYLDLSQEPAAVVEFEHERQRFTTTAFSFTSWVKQMIRGFGPPA